MADKKITELTPITGANLADADEFVVVDVSTDETKSVTRAEFFKNTPNITVTGTLTSDGLTVEDTGDTTLTVKALSSGAGNDDDANLVIDASGGGEAKINFSLDGAEKASIEWFNGGPDLNIKTASGTNGNIDFQPNESLAMRIDSNGNVGIGTSSSTIAANLHVNSGLSNLAGLFESDDAGTTITVIDNSTTGGSTAEHGLNCVGNQLELRAVDSLSFETAGSERLKVNSSGNVTPADDDAQDLGSNSRRWDDIYATNPTIQTSDRSEKQDIASLSVTEMLVAARLSTGFKNFKWKDRVASKGDDARLHSGAIAQDVQDAFTAEGLDAGNYAMFISATWWEHQRHVPAVEAVEGVDGVQAVEPVDYAEAVEATYDEDGIELTAYVPEVQEVEAVVGVEYVEAVEYKDAYTRTDTYGTLEEAPEGATERTRLGIRYPELLSFVAAYNEQRFTSIETRLATLEV